MSTGWCVFLAISVTYLKFWIPQSDYCSIRLIYLNLPFFLFCLQRTGVARGVGFYDIIWALLEILETLNIEYLNLCGWVENEVKHLGQPIHLSVILRFVGVLQGKSNQQKKDNRIITAIISSMQTV